jgi:hypothetical protein
MEFFGNFSGNSLEILSELCSNCLRFFGYGEFFGNSLGILWEFFGNSLEILLEFFEDVCLGGF